MKKFYTHNGVEQQGPFDLEDLKTKGHHKRHVGMVQWHISMDCCR